MMRLILLICFGLPTLIWADDRPVYWQYPGPFAERLEAAFSSIQSERDQHQLISESSRRKHLREKVKQISFRGCLNDDGICASEALGLLEAFGIGGRVLATARRTDLGYEVQLQYESAKHNSIRKFVAEASRLEQAAKEVLNALHGQGTLSLSLTPPDAFFFVNDVPYGQGSGDHLMTSGAHELRVEAPGFSPKKMSLAIETGQRIRVNVILVEAAAQFTLNTTPSDAQVFIDGERWLQPAVQKPLKAGQHHLRVELEGYNTFEKNIELKPSTVVNLKLKLVPSDPPWRRAIKRRLEDTTAHKGLISMHIGFIGVRDRAYDLETNLSKLEALNTPLSGQRLGFGLGVRKTYLLLDLLKVDYVIASGNARADLTRTRDEAEVTDLNQLNIAPAWIGGQFPIWRVAPYVSGGFLLRSETINGRSGLARFTGSQVELDLGLELGVRYMFSADWFAAFTYRNDGLIASGATQGFGLHVGHAFELPQTVKGWLP